MRQEREGLFRADGDCADERLFEDGAGLPLHGGAEPVHAAKGVEQAAQRGGRLLDFGEEIGRFFDFGNVGVGQFFDALHALGGVFGGLDGAAGGEAAETGELASGVVDAQTDERVAAAQVVVEEGEGRADGEAVEPEGDFGKLDGERVLVDAVDAALEDHAADDGLVGKLGFVDDPVGSVGAVEDVAAEGGDAVEQRRGVEVMQPGRGGRRVFGKFGDGVGKVVDGGDEKVAAAHGGVEYFEIERGLGGVETAQFGEAFLFFAAVALERVGPGLEGGAAFSQQRIEGALDDEVDERLRRVEAAAVLAGVAVGADDDLAGGVAGRFALEQALVDGAKLLDGHVAVVDEAAPALLSVWLRS